MWRAGLSYGFTSTRIRFGTSAIPGALETTSASLEKHAVSASLERRLGERVSVQAAAGATLAGTLSIEGGEHELLPGPLAAVGLSVRVVDERDAVPFVLLTGSLGVGAARTRAPGATSTESLLSFDGRLGIAVGKTIAGAVSPYVVARGFGLPVTWHYRGETITGGDAFHYQVGAGVAVRAGDFDVLVEGVPIGERAFTAGVGWSF